MTGLFDLDEGFYGAVVREMNQRGEWITPYFNGKPWFEKPILLYWLAKPFVALFGVDFGPRLPSVVSTIGISVVIAFFTKKNLGEKAAAYSVFAGGSFLLCLVLGRLMMTDAPLSLCLAVAFFSFYQSIASDRKWRWLTGLGLGLAILAKGPVALLLFTPIALLTYWRIPELRVGFKGNWLLPAILMLLVIATWYLPCYLVNRGEFVQRFLIEQNIGRFQGGDKAHSLGLAGLPFYLPILVISLFPVGWIEWKAFTKSNTSDPFGKFLAIYASVILLFFTISSAKLPHYILPMMPALAVLVGKRIATQDSSVWNAPAAPMALGIFWLLVLNPLQSYWYQASGQQEAHYLVRKHSSVAAVYQLSKRESNLKTGTTSIQETSLPSLIMYLGHPVAEPETFDDPRLLGNSLIFTRTNREIPNNWEKIESGRFYAVYRSKPLQK